MCVTGTFTGLPSLEFINLSNNKIESLPAGTVSLQTSLNYVYLHDNIISNIDQAALTGGWVTYGTTPSPSQDLGVNMCLASILITSRLS